LKNGGSAPATNVVLAITWGINLELREATSGHEDQIAQLTTNWRISQLAGGESVTRQLNCICLNPDEQGAVVRATVRSEQTAAVTDQVRTVITAAPAAPYRASPAPPSASPAAGTLSISAVALSNPIRLNETTAVVINVANNRQVSDQDVVISVQVAGDGLTIARVPGSPTPVVGSSATAVDFAPLRELAAGAQSPTPYRVEVRGLKPGRQQLRITATSVRSPTGVTANAEVIVNPP